VDPISIKEVREIPLADLVIGKGQVRLRDVGKEVDELADSIRVMGLIEPIVVCPTDKPGKYEIITGQRRFLAHQQLKRDKIRAVVLDHRVDEMTAKAVSVTENLVRRDLNNRDLIDACTALYKKYGTVRAVAEELGLPYNKVNQLVKYDRLQKNLRELVDKGDIDLKAALRAQDAASVSGKYDADEAVKLAKEMATMSGAQQNKLVKEIANNPTASVDEVIESAKSGEKIVQVIVTLGTVIHKSLQSYAKEEGTTQDDAAATLISEGLSAKGFLE
jgi:ParB family transcriptional regulator, chromosome partitioning protein